MIRVFGSRAGKEEIEEVSDSIKNQWLGAGPKLKEFESRFKRKINSDNFLMIDNASNGLYLAVKLLNLPAGSEIILPTFTWIACAHAINMCGCVPVFCDVNYETQNITADLIEPLITSKTKAIIVVHYAGLPVDMEPILQLGLPIIEDTAHAVNSTYQGKHCGTLGDFGVFSFDSMKNIAIGEGGGFTCKDEKLLERASRMRGCGMENSAYQQSGSIINRWWEQEAEEVFIKMKPSDISAGIALAQLSKIDKLQAKRKSIWDIYQNELAQYGDLILPVDVDDHSGSKHSYFTFLIKTKRRDDLAKYLYEQGIYTTLRFFPIHLMKLYNKGEKLSFAEKLKETALNIPLHPSLSETDLLKVIDKIKYFYTSKNGVKANKQQNITAENF